MSYEVANESGSLGQFASNGGYADFIAAAHSPALRSLIEHGASEDVPAIVRELDKLASEEKDLDVVTTIKTLKGLIEDEDLIVITNGTSEGDEDVEKAGENGVMLAFWPTSDQQKQIAVDGGESVADIHLTLAYFGKLSEMDLNCLPAMERAIEYFANTHGPVGGTLTGIGIFPATPSSDGKDVAYRGFHSDAIQSFRSDLVNACEQVSCEPKKNFGYNPHVTVKYMPPAAPHLLPHPENMELTFDRVTLSVGGATKSYPLVGVNKYSPDQPRDDHGRWGEKSGGDSSIKSALQDIQEKFPVNPEDPSERVLMAMGKPAVAFHLSERESRMRLNTIRALEPHSGAGTIAMQRIVRIADKHGVTMELTASPYGEGKERIGKDKLVSWYESHGFHMESGFDPALGYMIREPKVGKLDESDEFEFTGKITKLDSDKHVAFGWFSVISVGGRVVTDSQGDQITSETLESAAYEFVLNARAGGRMHEQDGDKNPILRGRLIESVVFTSEKQLAMRQSLIDQGIMAELDLKCEAWWGGFRFEDEDTWQLIKSGVLKEWSIGGRGKRLKLDE